MDHFLLEIDRGESTKNFPFDLHHFDKARWLYGAT